MLSETLHCNFEIFNFLPDPHQFHQWMKNNPRVSSLQRICSKTAFTMSSLEKQDWATELVIVMLVASCPAFILIPWCIGKNL